MGGQGLLLLMKLEFLILMTGHKTFREKKNILRSCHHYQNFNFINSRRPWLPTSFSSWPFFSSWPLPFLHQGRFGWDNISMLKLIWKLCYAYRTVSSPFYCTNALTVDLSKMATSNCLRNQSWLLMWFNHFHAIPLYEEEITCTSFRVLCLHFLHGTRKEVHMEICEVIRFYHSRVKFMILQELLANNKRLLTRDSNKICEHSWVI